MPLRPGESVGTAIRELRTGKTYRRSRKKRGKKAAEKQALAIALKNERKGKHKHRKLKKHTRRSRR